MGNRSSRRTRAEGSTSPQQAVDALRASTNNQHVRCDRCRALLLVPPGNHAFFACPCGNRMRHPSSASSTEGSAPDPRGSAATSELGMEQMVHALNNMNLALNAAQQQQDQSSSRSTPGRRTRTVMFGQRNDSERTSPEAPGSGSGSGSFLQRLNASEGRGNTRQIGGATLATVNQGRSTSSSVQVIMCEQCGRIGMLPNDQSTAVYLCPCGNPVLAATPNQLLSFLFRGGGQTALNLAGSNNGAPPGLVSSLPVLKFSKEESEKRSATQDEDDDKVSCRVCLSEYEDQEELKLLPCFHRFHTSCIDEWLKRSSACPLCNNSITRHENFDDS
mmetsp:Transcript_10463/g.13570  ORF Transcript_10463/g.13570 Transcript_10463/m.13570 type:complete len:332 (-) Transcript_10463:128-1123(-)